MFKLFKRTFFIFTILITTYYLPAQVNGVIKSSQSNKPLSGVKVFIDKTAISSLSNGLGQFTLENVPAGFHELVLLKEGYKLYKSSMKVLQGRVYMLSLSLDAYSDKTGKRPTLEELKDITSKLCGDSKCEILNSKDLRIKAGMISSTNPIVVENQVLGYLLHFFPSEKTLSEISEMAVYYENQLAKNLDQTIEWEKERQKLYKGSVRHWLTSLYAGFAEEQGFSIKDENGNLIDQKKLLTGSSQAGYKRLVFERTLSVSYREGEPFRNNWKVNCIGPIDINSDGLMISSKLLKISSEENAQAISFNLPLDYRPITGDVEEAYGATINQVFEKVYVHTDKPYYYSGEALWFRAYLNYYFPSWRDSLSKVLYVELIAPDRSIVFDRILKIDSGFSSGDFILPDTLKEGLYYLRAYTNLQRNFGEDNLFVKPIPLINLMDKVVYTNKNIDPGDPGLKIISDKAEYKTREKVSLTIELRDKEGNPIEGNLCVSVTDASQVFAVPEWGDIHSAYPVNKGEIKKVLDIKNRIENGVSFHGQFLGANSKPERMMLTFFQLNSQKSWIADADSVGEFELTDLHIYDTATLYYKLPVANGTPFGLIKELKRRGPPTNFKEIAYSLNTEKAVSVQRIISSYEVSKDEILLEGVVVKATRTNVKAVEETAKRPYGKGDYTLLAKDINTSYGNLLFALQGKFPGLIVRLSGGDWVVYSEVAASSSVNNIKEVLVLIDNVVMGGTAADILGRMDPTTVESIEYTNRLKSIYGLQGNSGVLSIYTKYSGLGLGTTAAKSGLKKMEVKGYSPSRVFKSPDYDDQKADKVGADYRSTIFWQPVVKTDPTTGKAVVEFFTSDLTGNYKVSLVGVTKKGEPVSAQSSITIH